VYSGSAGKIIDKILEEGFEVSAMQTFALDRPNAEEFLEVYKGVMPEYTVSLWCSVQYASDRDHEYFFFC